MVAVSEAFHIPLLFVDFLDNTPLRVLLLVHAAGPSFFALGTEAIDLELAIVVAHRHSLLSEGLLHVGLQGELGVGWDVGCQFLLVDLTRHNSIDSLVCARWELVARLSSELGTQLSIDLLFVAHRALDLLR